MKEKIKDNIKLLIKHPLFIKYQAVILPVISILICILIVIFVMLPQFFKFSENQKTLDQLKKKSDFYLNKAETLQKVDPQTYKKSLAESLVALPDDKDIPGVIGLVTILVSSNKLALGSLTFSSPALSADALGNLQIGLQVAGKKEDIQSFIAKAKEVPRLMTPTAITIHQLPNGQAQADLTLTSYYQSLPTQISSLDSQVELVSDEDRKNLERLKEFLETGTSEPAVGRTGGVSDPFK